ncbi:MAG: hypothetical protein GQ577_04260 [Woeseiaceae bacterium]|nr:hypothetical protein [Woeseiaceae bacterium]
MNRATKTLLIVYLGSLTYLSSSVSAQSQLAEEISVPEPTQLHTVASADGSEDIWSEFLGEIKSVDANAAITAIEVKGPDGERIRGVKITLENSTVSDQIYITDSLLSNLRDELQELEFTRQFDSECQAKYRCVHGIARCRPSQTERQAYCPGRYSTPNSEGGFVLSTPRNSFSFPSVEATQLDTLISKAVQVFD